MKRVDRWALFIGRVLYVTRCAKCGRPRLVVK